MAITTVSTQRAYLTDVVKGVNTYENSNAMEYNFGAIAVTSAFTAPTMGIPVVWDKDATTFVVYTDATSGKLAEAVASGDSPLAGNAPIGVVVGNEYGVGFDPSDVDYTSGQNVTAFFRGANNAGVVRSGINYSLAATSASNQEVFESQLEKQGIMVIDNAEVITPSFAQ